MTSPIEKLSRAFSRYYPFTPYSLYNALFLTALFGLANSLVRRSAGSFLAMDDTKVMLFAQSWQWGYQPDNPPLYEWLAIVLGPISGGGLWTFLLIKYACLTIAAGLAYKIVCAMAEAKVAFAATVGMVLLYQIGWNYHQAFTHSALLVPAVLAAIWSSLRYCRAPNWQNTIILGVIMGISLLTKYNAALYWGGFLLAASYQRQTRSAVLHWRIGISLLVAMLIISPHLVWFLEQTDAYRANIEAALGLGQESYIARLGEGLVSLLVSTATFFLPWGLLFVRRKRGYRQHQEAAFLCAISIIALGGMAVAVIIMGISNVSERYLIPVLMPAYLGLSVMLLSGHARRIRRVIAASAFMAALVLAIRLTGFMVPGPPFCDDCRHFVPYTPLIEFISETIPAGSILIVREEFTGGNLVGQFPDSPVRVFTSLRLTNPIKQDEGRPCYMVWSKDMIDPDLPLDKPIQYMEDDPSTILIDASWQHPLNKQGWRRTTWGLTPITKDSLYKEFCTSKR